MPRTAKRPTQNTNYGGSGQSAAPVVAARVQPVTTPTGLPYGEAGALADAQKQLPLPGAAPVGGGMSTQPAASPPQSQLNPNALTAATADTAPPIGMANPSTLPNQPMTAGLPSGPGPGPEALGLSQTPQTLADLLSRLAATNPDLAYLAATARSGMR